MKHSINSYDESKIVNQIQDALVSEADAWGGGDEDYRFERYWPSNGNVLGLDDGITLQISGNRHMWKLIPNVTEYEVTLTFTCEARGKDQDDVESWAEEFQPRWDIDGLMVVDGPSAEARKTS